MDLSVIGSSKELTQDMQFLYGKRSTSENRAFTLKVNTKDSFAKDRLERIMNFSRQQTYQLPNDLSRTRRNTKDDLDILSMSPLRIPDKMPDISFTTPKSYVAFSSPKHVNIKDIEEKLDRKHTEMCRSRKINLTYERLCSKKISEWSREKSFRLEEYQKRLDLLGRKSGIQPGKAEEYNSDEEDLSYSFSNVGKIRRKYRKLIDVSRHPDYFAPSGYMSMQPYSVYEKKPLKNSEAVAYESVKEAMIVKSSLAKYSIKCKLQEITGSLIDTSSKLLPIGGEGLLKRKVIDY